MVNDINTEAAQAVVDETIEAGAQATRNYAKRQMTWMRNQMSDWRIVTP